MFNILENNQKSGIVIEILTKNHTVMNALSIEAQPSAFPGKRVYLSIALMLRRAVPFRHANRLRKFGCKRVQYKN